MHAIAVEKLAKRYGKAMAVDGVDFIAPMGQTTALLGGNGAGKTTTIAMILGLVKPNGGTICVLDHDIAKDGAKMRAFMNFQSPYVNLPRRLSVRHNLEVYANLYGVPHAMARVEKLAADLRLEAFLDRPTGSLSAGQTTRVSLAKALINEPRVLLLDEPTASLDPDTADWVRTLLEEYQARTGAAIFLASHHMAEVERLATQVLMMKEGRIVDRGTPPQLLARYGRTDLEEVFLDIARDRRQAEPVT
ncbi:MAG: ABC transporter ATP-binding protein [Caulobacterales bacterium]